jgi:hypothetical protein
MGTKPQDYRSHTHSDGRECHQDLRGVWTYTKRYGIDQILYDHTCEREHKSDPTEATSQNKHFIHASAEAGGFGRRCMFMPSLNKWMHWDHEPPEPGPRERRNYECELPHPEDLQRPGPLPSERGEFGSPGVGMKGIARQYVDDPNMIAHPPLVDPDQQHIKFDIPMAPGKVLAVECPDDQALQELTMWVFRNAVITPGGRGMTGIRTDAVTEDAQFILSVVLPQLLEKFLRKNAQYARAQTGHDLGLKGIIPDINRKTAALISNVWDGGTNEADEWTDGVVDITEDLIGHLLLLLAKTRES